MNFNILIQYCCCKTNNLSENDIFLDKFLNLPICGEIYIIVVGKLREVKPDEPRPIADNVSDSDVVSDNDSVSDIETVAI